MHMYVYKLQCDRIDKKLGFKESIVIVDAGHFYVILRHQLFKFLWSDPRRREKLRGGNAGELEYSFLFEPAKAVDPIGICSVTGCHWNHWNPSRPCRYPHKSQESCTLRWAKCEHFVVGKHDDFWRYQLHQSRPSSKVNVWMVPMEVGFYFPWRIRRDLHSWYTAPSQVLLLVGKAQVGGWNCSQIITEIPFKNETFQFGNPLF